MTILDDDLERLDEPDTLPQEIVEWQAHRGHLIDPPTPAVAGAIAAGLIVGAFAVGAVIAVALARGRVRDLDVDNLIVRKLQILDR